MPMTWIVIAPAVTVETNVGPGRARVDFYRGQPLPAEVAAEDLEALRRLGAIDVAPKEAQSDPDPVPAGSIEAVLAWVGEDRDRAVRALDTENAAKTPRKTLVAKLEELAAVDE